MGIDSVMTMPRAGRYSNPRDSTAILPKVFGDTLSSTAVPPDDIDGGFTPAVNIDQVNLYYCINDGPSHPDPPKVYMNDYLQAPSVYVYTPATDFEGTGNIISVLRFLVDPGLADISVRFKAMVDGTGALIENPMIAIMDAFTKFGSALRPDFPPSNFDAASRIQSQLDMQSLGYTMHWVFDEEKTYREWLQEILVHFHTDFLETEASAVAIMVDRSVTNMFAGVVPIIAEIDVMSDGVLGDNDGPRLSSDEVNIRTVVKIKAGYKWTTGEFTEEQEITLRRGFNTYGPRRVTYELRGLRTQAHRDQWIIGFANRYDLQPQQVTFTTRTLRFLAAMPGTFIAFTWPKMAWTRRLLKVLNVSIDPWAQSQTFTCFDTLQTAGTPPPAVTTTATAKQRIPLARPVTVLT